MGRRSGRGGRVMNNVIKIIIAIVIVIVAWKILKGLLGLAVGIAVAGLIIYGGVKLLEGPKR